MKNIDNNNVYAIYYTSIIPQYYCTSNDHN